MSDCPVCQSVACTAGPGSHAAEEIKIGYYTASGASSTAYVVRPWGSSDATGTDKYTDRAVTVRWDGIDWREV